MFNKRKIESLEENMRHLEWRFKEVVNEHIKLRDDINKLIAFLGVERIQIPSSDVFVKKAGK